MRKKAKPKVDVNEPDTWVKYRKGLCRDCTGACCSLPVEAKLSDLVRMELVDPFEAEVTEPKKIAKRLLKSGAIQHFSAKSKKYTLAQRANNDCFYLDQSTRRCTIYAKRPNVCREHPRVGPRAGFCAYQQKPKSK
ncbi:MAG: YkgJ family cysteine cluster protein [Candidatus Promineifilaceae bacterium]